MDFWISIGFQLDFWISDWISDDSVRDFFSDGPLDINIYIYIHITVELS